MASKFVGVRFSKALRAALPIYVVFLVTITFTIYFPKVVLWLPKQVIPESVGCFKSPSGTGYICPNPASSLRLRRDDDGEGGVNLLHRSSRKIDTVPRRYFPLLVNFFTATRKSSVSMASMIPASSASSCCLVGVTVA